MAWLTGWSNREKITVDYTKVGTSVSNFTVYVDLSDLSATFFSTVKSDGADIRITQTDGTTLQARAIVNISTGSSTGELKFKASSLSNVSDTDFYIYYGNSGASEPSPSDTYGSENVGDSNLISIYYMNEDPSGTPPQILDGTGNNNDGTSGGTMTSGDLLTSLIGKCLDFDGADDFIEVNGIVADITTSSPWTVSIVAHMHSSVGSRQLFALVEESGSERVGFGTSAGYLKVFSNGKTTGNGSAITNNVDYLFSLVWDGTKFIAYLNGSEDYNVTPSSSITWASIDGARIACTVSGGSETEFTSSEIDEIRFSSTERSAGWLLTEHNNLLSVATFYSISAPESEPVVTFIPKIMMF